MSLTARSIILSGTCRGEKGRNATKKAIQETIVISSDDEGEDNEDNGDDDSEDDETDATPVPKTKAKGARRWVDVNAAASIPVV